MIQIDHNDIISVPRHPLEEVDGDMLQANTSFGDIVQITRAIYDDYIDSVTDGRNYDNPEDQMIDVIEAENATTYLYSERPGVLYINPWLL